MIRNKEQQVEEQQPREISTMTKTIRTAALLLAILALIAASCSSDSTDDVTSDTTDSSDTADTDSGDDAPDTDSGDDAPDTATPADDGAVREIKVGAILPLTGGIAGPGADAKDSLELFFNTFGDGESLTTSNGVKITLVLEDNASDPAVALTVATKLLEVDDVDIVLPGILASTGTAVGDALGDRDDVLLLSPSSCNDDFTQRAPLKGYARPAGWACSQTSHAFGQWAFEEKGLTACTDYTFGYEHCGGFADGFTNSGGTIVDQIWHPLFNSDFGTYSTQMNDLDVEAVFVLAVGGSVNPMVTAYADFGLKESKPMLAGVTTMDQSALRAMDKEVAIGTIGHSHWAEGNDDPSTVAFVAAYEEATDKIASYYAAGYYGAMQWVVAAAEQMDDEFTPDGMLNIMKDGLAVDTAFGTQTMNDDGSMTFNVFITEVQEREDGQLWNVPIFTYEGVDQYFQFDKDEYLAQPTYTKDFQGTGVGG
jgi:branched-chain amino acid transport system substrate-binding protein